MIFKDPKHEIVREIDFSNKGNVGDIAKKVETLDIGVSKKNRTIIDIPIAFSARKQEELRLNLVVVGENV